MCWYDCVRAWFVCMCVLELESLNGQYAQESKALDALLQTNNRDTFGEHIPIQAITRLQQVRSLLARTPQPQPNPNQQTRFSHKRKGRGGEGARHEGHASNT